MCPFQRPAAVSWITPENQSFRVSDESTLSCVRIAGHNPDARSLTWKEALMTTDRSLLHYLLCISIVIGPLSGCSDQPKEEPDETPAQETADVSAEEPRQESPTEPTGEPEAPGLMDQASGAWESSKAMAESGWNVLTEQTQAGLVVAGEKLGQGKDQTLDASNAVWVWPKDKSVEGWSWVSENAAGAVDWAADSASDAWKVTRKESGEFALWVKVEVEDGVAWTKTALPEAWEVTKDAGGQAWVWIEDHKVEASVAAAAVAIVVTALMAAPEVVAVAAVKGAIAGGSSSMIRFLADVWKSGEVELETGKVSQDVFNGIGKSVLAQSGPQILAGLFGADSA